MDGLAWTPLDAQGDGREAMDIDIVIAKEEQGDDDDAVIDMMDGSDMHTSSPLSSLRELSPASTLSELGDDEEEVEQLELAGRAELQLDHRVDGEETTSDTTDVGPVPSKAEKAMPMVDAGTGGALAPAAPPLAVATAEPPTPCGDTSGETAELEVVVVDTPKARPAPRLAKSTAAAAAVSNASPQTTPRTKIGSAAEADEACPICAHIPPEQKRVKGARERDDWIACDQCARWFHWQGCAKRSAPPKTHVKSFEEWYCNDCALRGLQTGNPISMKLKEGKRPSKKKGANAAGAGGADGDASARAMPSAPSAVSEAKSGKAWHSIADTRPHTNSKFKQMKGSELTLEWLESDPRAFSEPIFIAKPDGLDMRVLPVDIKISDIAALVGVDKALDVIDVASQSGLSNWTLGKWAEYYESDPTARDKIRNVISLELSDSPIRDRIASPKLVREIDWVENYWPSELIEQNVYPQVSRYCLMSPGQSWTDWHCDFSASSVYYHILRGSKVFYFISPTPANLRLYELWSGSQQQHGVWLGDMCDRVYKISLSAGNTMIIPSGWIHCVYTPTDALVIGGNFLHSYHIPIQLRVYQIELTTKVPKKFRFPYFVTMLWYVALHHYRALLGAAAASSAEGHASIGGGSQTNGVGAKQHGIPHRVLVGLKSLSAFLIEQVWRTSPGARVSPERRRVAKENVPWHCIADPEAVAKGLQRLVYAALGEEMPHPPLDGIPVFDAQDWLVDEGPYILPPKPPPEPKESKAKRKAETPSISEGSPAPGFDAHAKARKLGHTQSSAAQAAAGIIGTAVPGNGSSAFTVHDPAIPAHANGTVSGSDELPAARFAPRRSGASKERETPLPATQPERVEKQTIGPITSSRTELRTRPRPPTVEQVDLALFAPGSVLSLSAANVNAAVGGADMQEAEVKTTASQATTIKTLPGELPGSWVIETRRVVTTVERVYFSPPKLASAQTAQDASTRLVESASLPVQGGHAEAPPKLPNGTSGSPVATEQDVMPS